MTNSTKTKNEKNHQAGGSPYFLWLLCHIKGKPGKNQASGHKTNSAASTALHRLDGKYIKPNATGKLLLSTYSVAQTARRIPGLRGLADWVTQEYPARSRLFIFLTGIKYYIRA